MFKTKFSLHCCYFTDILEWPQSKCSQSSIQQKICVSISLGFFIFGCLILTFPLFLIPELIVGVGDDVTEQNQQDKSSAYECHFSKAVSSSLLVLGFFPKETLRIVLPPFSHHQQHLQNVDCLDLIKKTKKWVEQIVLCLYKTRAMGGSILLQIKVISNSSGIWITCSPCCNIMATE